MLDIAEKNLSKVEECQLERKEDHIFLGQHIIAAIKTNNKPNRLYSAFNRLQAKEGIEAIQDQSDLENYKGYQGYPSQKGSYNKEVKEALSKMNRVRMGNILPLTIEDKEEKYTTIKALVYNNYIREALAEGSTPVTVYAANKESIEDVLKSFELPKENQDNILFTYWLEQKISDVTYIKESPDRDSQTLTKEGQGFLEKLDVKKYIDDARKLFLYNSYLLFGKPFDDLTTCKNLIHSRLYDLNYIKEELLEMVDKKPLKLSIEEKDEVLSKLREIEEEINSPLNRIKEWEDFLEKQPKGPKFLVKKKIEENFNQFILPQEKERISVDMQIEEIRQILEKDKQAIEAKHKDSLLELRKKEGAYKLLDQLKKYDIDLYNKLEDVNLDSLNRLLDSSLRYHQIWYASHYYECRFLMGEYSLKEEVKNSTKKEDLEKRFRRLSMISPLLVMDFELVPCNLFSYASEDKPRFPIQDFLDLIIIDQADQIEGGLGANILYFAKKAIFLGDKKPKEDSLMALMI